MFVFEYIKLHRELLKDGNIAFGSIVQIEGLKNWSDKNIVQLAFAANEGVGKPFQASLRAIADAMNRWPGRVRRPMVTTVVIIDNTAYISTSMRGESYLYALRNKNEPYFTTLQTERCPEALKKALGTCQLKAAPHYGQQPGHRTGGNCGEPVALLSFC